MPVDSRKYQLTAFFLVRHCAKIRTVSKGSPPWQGQASRRCSPKSTSGPAPNGDTSLKITLTVECSPWLFAALLALAGTFVLLASGSSDGIKNPATAAILMAALLFARLLSGPRT